MGLEGATYAQPETQAVELVLQVLDPDGATAKFAEVVVFHLADGGPKMLARGSADFQGIYHVNIEIPRKTIASFNGTIVYASINIWVIATTPKGGELGTLTTPLDPTWMTWPFDVFSATVNLRKVQVGTGQRQVSGVISQSAPPYPYYEEKYEYTTVLQFAIWDSIDAQYDYVAGSKISVQSKERWYDVLLQKYVTDWFDGGYTYVTLDRGLLSSWLSGRLSFTIKFELKYAYRTEYNTQLMIIIEHIYAVDTATDPRDYTREECGWSGALPGYANYYRTPQGDTTSIPITGTSEYTWSVSVSFSIPVPPYTVGTTLGVTKVPSPVSYLRIQAGTWTQGYKVRTESPNTSFLKSYSNWVQ